MAYNKLPKCTPLQKRSSAGRPCQAAPWQGVRLMSFPNSNQVQEAFSKFNSDWNYEHEELEKNLEFRFSKDDREAVFRWSQEMPEEVWFSLSNKNVCDLTDWTEMFEKERNHKALFEYLELVTHRYLECDTRIKKKFVYFGEGVLQYLKDGKWYELRSPI